MSSGRPVVPYTKTPKWILKAIALGQFKPLETRLLAFFVDRVCGFNDRRGLAATPKEIAAATNIGVDRVRPALRALTLMGALVESEHGFAPASEQPISMVVTIEIECAEHRNSLPEASKKDAHDDAESTPGAVPVAPLVNSQGKIGHGRALRGAFSENSGEQEWIASHFGVPTWEETYRISDLARREIQRFLTYPQGLRLRAIAHAMHPDSNARNPVKLVLHLLENPHDIVNKAGSAVPVSSEAPAPNPFAGFAWGARWEADRHKPNWAGVMNFCAAVAPEADPFEAGAIFQARGVEAACDWIWSHRAREAS